MARTILRETLADIEDAGIVTFPDSELGTGAAAKIPARGHDRWGLEVVTKTAGGSEDVHVQLKGTNNPDPSDTNGEVLIDADGITTATTTHESTETSGNIRNAYKYVFVHAVTVDNLVIDAIRLYGAGFSGQE